MANLPRAEHAYGVHDKLIRYTLRTEHEDGGPKAAAFVRILGITLADVDYLEGALLAGIRGLPVFEVRDGGEHGMHCQVTVPVRGVRERNGRVANVLTAWELRYDGDAPRLVTAFITSKVVR